jgi:hypothetical protein
MGLMGRIGLMRRICPMGRMRPMSPICLIRPMAVRLLFSRPIVVSSTFRDYCFHAGSFFLRLTSANALCFNAAVWAVRFRGYTNMSEPRVSGRTPALRESRERASGLGTTDTTPKQPRRA